MARCLKHLGREGDEPDPDGYSEFRYHLYGADGDEKRLIGKFAIEEIAGFLRDTLGAADWDLAFLGRFVAKGSGGWDERAGGWQLHQMAHHDSWEVTYYQGSSDEIGTSIASFRDVGAFIPMVLFKDLKYVDPEVPRNYAADYNRRCREDYFDKFTSDPLTERLFRFMHQVEKETGNDFDQVSDLDELHFAVQCWRGYELPGPRVEDRDGAVHA